MMMKKKEEKRGLQREIGGGVKVSVGRWSAQENKPVLEGGPSAYRGNQGRKDGKSRERGRLGSRSREGESVVTRWR